ncbi:hypothetical protein GCM10020001_083270 [Nonomuraea salmonea]
MVKAMSALAPTMAPTSAAALAMAPPVVSGMRSRVWVACSEDFSAAQAMRSIVETASIG